MIMAFVGMWACDPAQLSSIKEDELAVNAKTEREVIGDSDSQADSSKAVCSSATWQLNAGNTFIDAGSVTVSNDSDSIYITVHATYGFQNTTEQIKVWVGTSLDQLPVNKQGVPIPGKFPYKKTMALGENEYTFSISLSSLDASCSSSLHVYVHADVYSDFENTPDTAWGGDTCQESQDSGAKRWVCSGIYQAVCCETTPDEESGSSETAFAKGGWVFTTDAKSNPESLPTLALSRNRWGWAINLTAAGNYSYDIWAAAGLNDTSNGTLVGKLAVSWDGSIATVTYTLNAGFTMATAHIYADDAKPTTIAPGQFGNIIDFAPKASTYSDSYSVSISDNADDNANEDGIWIIAHADVYGNF